MSNKLESLTRAQKNAIPKYYNKWYNIGTDTQPGNIEKAKELVKTHYKAQGHSEPKEIIVFDGPYDAAYLAAYGKLHSFEDTMEAYNNGTYINELKNNSDFQGLEFDGFGQFDAHWLAYYDFLINETDVEVNENVKNLIELAEHVSFYWAFDKMFIMVKKISDIHLENDQLHNVFGPALDYPDGFPIYALEGKHLSYDEWEKETRPYRSDLAKEIFKKV